MKIHLLLLVSLFSAPLFAADFYVAPAGNDANDGTKNQPFATLERARDAVRDAKAPDGSTIWLRGGIYYRTASFELAAADSGTAQAPIIYRAFGDENVVLSGGRLINNASFRPVPESITARLDPAARGQVFQLDLAPLKLKTSGPFPDVFRDGGGLFELFGDGVRLPLSRWPNHGYSTMERVLDKGEWNSGAPKRGGVFVFRDERAARWKADGNLWVNGFWRVPWQPEAVRVAAIDPAKRSITMAAPVSGGIGSKYAGAEGSGKEPWQVINALEEIDQPGEWCVDFGSKTLYLWPPAPLDKTRIAISDLDAPLVKLQNVSHLSLRGLTLENGLGNGIEIGGGENIAVVGCTLRRLGRSGVVVKGGARHGVRSCDLYELGEGGIYLSGGDRKTLTPAGHFAENNHIYYFGARKKTYAPGIAVGAYDAGAAVGCRVTNNFIHDAPHAAVLYGGNDNIFEYNEVLRVALDSGDVGAFYTWHDWTSRGNILRFNIVRDSPNANAFYMDDSDSGDTVESNVVLRTSYGPFIGGGHDNLVRYNIVIAAERGLHLDARGVARGYDKDANLLKGLAAVNYRQPPWSERYPALTKLPENHSALPTGNVMERNLTIACKKPLNISGTPDELRFSLVRDNVDIPLAEAGWSDNARLEDLLRADAPLWKKVPDFPRVPLEKIGLFTDEYRRALPNVPRGLTAPVGAAFDSETDVKNTDQRVRKPLTLAAYYIWYSTAEAAKPWSHWTYDAVKKRHGDSNPLAQPGDPPLSSSAYPLAGLYSSQDQNLAAWHMNLAKAAGIDAFLVSWWGRNNGTDAAFEKATLPAAEKTGFKVALLDELAQFHSDDAVYQAGLASALKKFKDSPAYLKIDGRPVVYLYQVAAKPGLSPESFAKVRAHVEREVGPVYWIVDKLAHNHKAKTPEQTKHIPPDWLGVAGIDCFAFYSTFSHFRAHRYEELVGQYRYLAESAHRAGKKMLLPVHPGHDNSRYSEQTYEMPRRDGETLREYLRAATEAGADAILVTSWNEWPETTIVEPARTWPDPYQYLKILADWKGITFDQPLGPPALQK